MSDRMEGYYWVRYGGDAPIIAEWVNGRWWITASEMGDDDHEGIEVLVGPLQPPRDRAVMASESDAAPRGGARERRDG